MEKPSLIMVLMVAFLFIASGPLITSARPIEDMLSVNFNQNGLYCNLKEECPGMEDPLCKVADCDKNQCIYICA
ncbi:hypothetical protein Leryth_001962 [Lithospermum erythrorhizon]|nr:hypothetical protein Leryth_001962 [Lithospermum erythrorhizon]